MAQPNKPAKTMSSRLSTMKFMQRSAASTPSSPSTPVEQPSKRQRLSTASYNGTPSSTPQTDVQSTEEGAASDVHQHIDKVNKDGKWYLSYEAPQISSAHTPLRVISAGYSTLDTNDSAGRESTTIELPGRRSFGNFNRKVEKRQNPDTSSGDSSSEPDSQDDEDDENESDDPTGAKAMIAQSRREAGEKARVARKAKRKADKAEAAQQADERRKKQVNLNNLGSISGISGSNFRPKDMECFNCGKKGHAKRDCPQRRQYVPKRPRSEDGG